MRYAAPPKKKGLPTAKRTLRKRLANKGQDASKLPSSKKTLRSRLGDKQLRKPIQRPTATTDWAPGTKPTGKTAQAQPYRKGTAKPRSRTAALTAMKRGKPRYTANPAAAKNEIAKRAAARRRKLRKRWAR